MRYLIASFGLVSLAACTIATSDATAPGTPAAACRNKALGQFANQPASPELGARMLRESGARTIRWVPKGHMVTMEFNAERVTVSLDGANRVERASCG